MVWDCLLLSAQCSIFLSLPQPQQLVSLVAYPASPTQMCAFVYSSGYCFRVHLWVCPLYKQCQFSSTLDIKRLVCAIFVEMFSHSLSSVRKKTLVFHKTFCITMVLVFKVPQRKSCIVCNIPIHRRWDLLGVKITHLLFGKRMNI